MKTITDKNGTRALISNELYDKLFPPLKVGDWIMIEDCLHVCTTHPTGKNYPGWVEGMNPDVSRPAQIIDILPLKDQPDVVCVVFQGGESFVFANMSGFYKAASHEVERYHNEFKIGDWVIGKGNNGPPKPEQIEKWFNETRAQLKSGNRINIYTFGIPFVRHVTPDERRQAEKEEDDHKIMLDGRWEAIISPNGGYITVACRVFSFEKVAELYEKMKSMQK